MGFDSFGKEDIQEDTYMYLGALIRDAGENLRMKNAEGLYSDLEIIYYLVHMRMDDEEDETFSKQLENINKFLFSEGDKNGQELSIVFDREKKLFKKLTRLLDDMGILFRIRADPNLLVTGGR